MARGIITIDDKLVAGAVKKINKALKTIEPRARKKAMTRAARSAMKPILTKVRSNAPKMTSALRKSIRMRALKRRRSSMGVTVATKDDWFKGDEYYGAFQEFSWKTGSRKQSKSGATRKQIPGLHFVEDAFKASGNGALRRFLVQVPKEIEKLAKGGK